MSGGSFNYLCVKDAAELMQETSTLEEMEQTLLDLGYEDAANDTAQVIHLIDKCTKDTESLALKLSDVWKAVEWKVSNDYGDEEVKAAVKQV